MQIVRTPYISTRYQHTHQQRQCLKVVHTTSVQEIYHCHVQTASETATARLWFGASWLWDTAAMPRRHLKTTSEFQILEHLCFLFRIKSERVAIKTRRAESSFVTGPGKYTAFRRVRAPFRPDFFFFFFTGLGSKGVKRQRCSLAELTAGAWAGWMRLAIYEK